jgi:hypothetical protein
MKSTVKDVMTSHVVYAKRDATVSPGDTIKHAAAPGCYVNNH